MTMTERYQKGVESYAYHLADTRKERPEVRPTDRVVIDDISTQYEKTMINRLERKYSREMRDFERYDIKYNKAVYQARLDILERRKEVVYG